MLTLDSAATFLLDRALIDVASIIDGDLLIRSLARRNHCLRVEGPKGGGLFLKWSGDGSEYGHETVEREASFLRFCQDEPAVAELAGMVPRLIRADDLGSVTVLGLIPDSVTLWSYLEEQTDQEQVVAAARAFGRALGSVHRVLTATDWAQEPRLGPLPRSLPWVMTFHRPDVAFLAELSPGGAEVLRIVQSQGAIAEKLERLGAEWQPDRVIHGDVRLDNVLIRRSSAGAEDVPVELWIIDWEMVAIGDPAWDLAGALQDFLAFWVSTMPLSHDLTTEQMLAQARVPIASLRRAIRAMWSGYRQGARMEAAAAVIFIERAVKFSAVRLIQSAFETAHGWDHLPGRAVLLLQIATNLLAEPECGQMELYGITHG